jgi:hypothetical protein
MARGLPGAVAGAQRWLRKTALDPRIDDLATTAERAAAPEGSTARQVLRGDWLGHALHPLLTDFTAGPWMAASFLDLFGPRGSAPAARRLVGFGLLAAVPTWLSGVTDWRETDARERRLGLLHAATSSTATLLYACSYVARRRGRQRPGVVLGLAGGVVEMLDGYIGGELSLVGKVGTGRRTLDQRSGG